VCIKCCLVFNCYFKLFFSFFSIGLLSVWCEDLGRQLLLRHQKSHSPSKQGKTLQDIDCCTSSNDAGPMQKHMHSRLVVISVCIQCWYSFFWIYQSCFSFCRSTKSCFGGSTKKANHFVCLNIYVCLFLSVCLSVFLSVTSAEILNRNYLILIWTEMYLWSNSDYFLVVFTHCMGSKTDLSGIPFIYMAVQLNTRILLSRFGNIHVLCYRTSTREYLPFGCSRSPGHRMIETIKNNLIRLRAMVNKFC